MIVWIDCLLNVFYQIFYHIFLQIVNYLNLNIKKKKMDFSFSIPCTNEDLLNTCGDKYYVKQVYDCREIPDQLKSMLKFLIQNN